jgi:hypothetical protein
MPEAQRIDVHNRPIRISGVGLQIRSFLPLQAEMAQFLPISAVFELQFVLRNELPNSAITRARAVSVALLSDNPGLLKNL